MFLDLHTVKWFTIRGRNHNWRGRPGWFGRPSNGYGNSPYWVTKDFTKNGYIQKWFACTEGLTEIFNHSSILTIS